ncbi:MAG TPA: fatty acid desaturase [Candidatus Acidoferrales bacterium]|nr:fatty acid desaturase [Candidatus Acidoferrales bacterium]
MKTGFSLPTRHERKPSAEIYFCNNPKGLEAIDLTTLPPEKRAAIRRLHRLDDRHNLRILFFVALWAVAAWAALASDRFVVQLFSNLAIIGSLIGFTVLLHEASHRLLFKHPVLNQWVGFLCGLPILLSVSGFRTNHLAHHERRGSTFDPNDVGANFRDSLRSACLYYVSIWIRAYGFLTYLPWIGLTKGNPKARVRTLIEYVLIAAFAGAIFWLFPADTVLKLWILPLLISAHLTELRAVAEHGLTTRGNVFTATRTVVSNRWVSFMMCNINYHLEHHLFPAVPWYNLPKVHRLLRDEYRQAGCSVYSSYTEFFIDFLKASSGGIAPNARLIPADARKALGC